MKKRIAALLTALCLLMLTGCEDTSSMEYLLDHATTLVGTVEEVSDHAILLRSVEGELYSVSTDVKFEYSQRFFNVWNVVTVYYDGIVAESYPMQIHTVYAIVLNDIANVAEPLESETPEPTETPDSYAEDPMYLSYYLSYNAYIRPLTEEDENVITMDLDRVLRSDYVCEHTPEYTFTYRGCVYRYCTCGWYYGDVGVGVGVDGHSAKSGYPAEINRIIKKYFYSDFTVQSVDGSAEWVLSPEEAELLTKLWWKQEFDVSPIYYDLDFAETARWRGTPCQGITEYIFRYKDREYPYCSCGQFNNGSKTMDLTAEEKTAVDRILEKYFSDEPIYASSRNSSALWELSEEEAAFLKELWRGGSWVGKPRANSDAEYLFDFGTISYTYCPTGLGQFVHGEEAMDLTVEENAAVKEILEKYFPDATS